MSPPDATPWREWAKANHIGVNFAWRSIASRQLKVRRVGKRMLVLNQDGLKFLRSLPSGPPDKREYFKRKVTK
jgi:hypothetical protein